MYSFQGPSLPRLVLYGSLVLQKITQAAIEKKIYSQKPEREM
jgi:hypothetical protein